MEAYEMLLDRKSCRKYENRAVEDDKIERTLNAGVYAPTGAGNQSPIIIAVTNRKTRDLLSRLNADVMGSSADPFYGAPVVLVVLAGKKYATGVYDGSTVLENMMLAATAEGLGSCWIHRAKEVFETEEGRNILKSLGIDEEYEGIGNMILGYPAGYAPERAPRKDHYVYYIR